MNNFNPRAVVLTATQKGVLAILHNSPTPESAFEAVNGSPALITARNLLERLGLIVVAGVQASLTDAGRRAVVASNITDESGQITDEGAALIDAVKVRKVGAVSESFALLSSLI